MAKTFSVSDLHRLSPAADPASSLNVAAFGPETTCLQTIVDTGGFTSAAEDEK